MTDTNKCKEQSFFVVKPYGFETNMLTIEQYEEGKPFNFPVIIDWTQFLQVQFIEPKQVIYFNKDWSTNHALGYGSEEM